MKSIKVYFGKKTQSIYKLMYKSCQCVRNMKFRKEIIIFSLVIIFMLMSAVSAEENITDDSASDYVELDSDSSYSENVSDDSIIDDNVADENISEDNSGQDISPGSLNGHAGYEFNSIAKAGASSSKNIYFHKSSSYSPYSKNADADVAVNGHTNEEMFSNFDMCGDSLTDSIYGENYFTKTDSSYQDYSKADSSKNLIDENNLGDVFKANIHIDLKTIDYLISFMGAGAENIDFPIADIFDVDAFLDIFDKIMNSPSTHNTMTNIPSYNNDSTLRNQKYCSTYSLYPDDLDDGMDLFIKSDNNTMVTLEDTELLNQTFDLKTIHDVCINSYGESDLQLSDGDSFNEAQDNTVEIQCFKFSPQINCLSDNISEDIQHNSYPMIGCECTNTGFSKQHNSYDNLDEVSKSDTITRTEEDNHDNVLFKKHNVSAPFIVENHSVFALFGVIKITIP